MEVVSGYKKTDVEIFPKDWVFKKIGEIADIFVGGDLQLNNFSEYEDTSYRFPVFSNTVDNQGLYGYYKIKEYDGESVTIVGRGVGLGTAFYRSGGFVAIGRLLVLFPHSNINAKFLTYYINQRVRIYTESGGIPQLTGISVKKYIVAIPPTKQEQTAIAQVLSDTDELISSLEKLIEKKKQIKQGTMQQLLTGKKRLPGFSGEWQSKKLGDIGEITGAGIDKKIRPNEASVRLVNYLDVYHRNFIYSKDLNHWVTAQEAQAERCRVKKGDIFFTPSSETPDDIGISSIAAEDIEDAGYSYHVVRLRLFEDWDFNFRAYIFKTRFFLDQAEKFCEGSGKRYVISLKRFRELEIFYPTDKKEQEGISDVLRDIDFEIEIFEQKLNKYKSIKQGMMQNLLTGKIRLV